MRRMITTKQSDYINDLSQVAEKGFKIGTYPHNIIGTGIFDFETNLQAWIDNDELNFENHIIASGAYYTFYYPELLKHYGLGEAGSNGYVSFVTSSDFEFPSTINTSEALMAYLQTPEGQQSLYRLLDSEAEVDDSFMSNDSDTTSYSVYEVYGFYSEQGQLVIDTEFVCTKGEGEEITGASDPITEPTLKTGILQVEKFGFKIINSTPSYDAENYQITFEFNEELEQGLYILLFENIGVDMDSSFACLLYVKSEYGLCSGVPQSDPDTQPFMFSFYDNVLTYTGASNGIDGVSCKAVKIPL